MYGQFPQNAGAANVGRALHSNLFFAEADKKKDFRFNPYCILQSVF